MTQQEQRIFGDDERLDRIVNYVGTNAKGELENKSAEVKDENFIETDKGFIIKSVNGEPNFKGLFVPTRMILNMGYFEEFSGKPEPEPAHGHGTYL